jgi:hypothetical protein
VEAIEASVPKKLAIYLGGKYKSLPGQAGQCLEWWKVSETKTFSTIKISCMVLRLIQQAFTLNQEHHQEFPVLASLAKDYLACSATSASVERYFSADADVCGPDRGRLSIRTIERSVSCDQWLKQGFKANDEFQTAQDLMEEEESKTKLATA